MYTYQVVANAVSSPLLIPFDGLEKTEATFTFFSIKNALSDLEHENTYTYDGYHGYIMQIMSDDMYLKINTKIFVYY